MRYGALPKELGLFELKSNEMFCYQYLPIKMPHVYNPLYEDRLHFLDKMIGAICCDFIGEYGLNSYMDCYCYLTAKRLFEKPGCPINRPGYHSDGFMTSDINYIWCDKNPTIFNDSDFKLTQDDSLSLKEMEEQADKSNEITFPVNTLLRLNQYNIHKVAEVNEAMLRTFVKVSFSADKYDLDGNSHNYLLDYQWQMKARKAERNIPQSILSSAEIKSKRHSVEIG